jgi:uncharacterized protein YndB with AHSA1/START domain
MTPTISRAGNTTDREIITSRLLNAPRELVFEVWTKPEHIAHWWGPNGFTNTIYEMEVKPGGEWKFMMHGPDGTDFPNMIVYEEVVRPEKLVYLHGSETDGKFEPRFHVIVTFEDVDGQTNLTMHSVFKTAEERNFVVEKFGAIEGAKQNLERLEKYVLAMR